MGDYAIVQLASWGDVLLTTIVSHAIKAANGDNMVTTYTTGACAGAVTNNRDIDNLVIIPGSKNDGWGMQDAVIARAKSKHDHVIAPWPGFRQRHDWIRTDATKRQIYTNFMWSYVRSAQEAGFDVPDPPVTYLWPSAEEIAHVQEFLDGQFLGRPSVLMEIGGESGQTFWDDNWTNVVVTALMRRYGKEINIWISSGGPEPVVVSRLKQEWTGRISYLPHYALREMAVLINSADIFIGCSSGTSNACQTHLCVPPRRWFEAINDPVWDSTPIRQSGMTINGMLVHKYHYYGADATEFANNVLALL